MRIRELLRHLGVVEGTRGDVLVLLAHPEREGVAFGLARGDIKAVEIDSAGRPKQIALVLTPHSPTHTQAPGIVLPAVQKGNDNEPTKN